MRSIHAEELAELLAQTAVDIDLIDVRESWEHNLAALERARHIPMGDIARRLDELTPAHTTVVMCHHGNRSRTVCRFLETHGFKDVVNLEGGIDEWAERVDPDMARY